MSSRRKAISLLFGVLVLVLGLAMGGCSSESSAPPAQSGGEATSEGAQLVEQKCKMCHSLDRVTQATKTAEEWTTTVERMEANGLVLTDAEKTTIIDYLAGQGQ